MSFTILNLRYGTPISFLLWVAYSPEPKGTGTGGTAASGRDARGPCRVPCGAARFENPGARHGCGTAFIACQAFRHGFGWDASTDLCPKASVK